MGQWAAGQWAAGQWAAGRRADIAQLPGGAYPDKAQDDLALRDGLAIEDRVDVESDPGPDQLVLVDRRDVARTDEPAVARTSGNSTVRAVIARTGARAVSTEGLIRQAPSNGIRGYESFQWPLHCEARSDLWYVSRVTSSSIWQRLTEAQSDFYAYESMPLVRPVTTGDDETREP
jgi:hypothetical protein